MSRGYGARRVGTRAALGQGMRKTKTLGKKLSLKKETIRNLVANELELVNGGAVCTTLYYRCSTGSIDKCYTGLNATCG
jgi:hypothetical protein